MPPERGAPGSPEEWLRRARGDLALAGAPLPEGAFYEDLCFHVQQAAEKAVKAIYRVKGISFSYTHDLAFLLHGLKTSGIEVPKEIEEAAKLSRYASHARYPGLEEPVLAEEHASALNLARGVVSWAEILIESVPEEREEPESDE